MAAIRWFWASMTFFSTSKGAAAPAGAKAPSAKLGAARNATFLTSNGAAASAGPKVASAKPRAAGIATAAESRRRVMGVVPCDVHQEPRACALGYAPSPFQGSGILEPRRGGGSLPSAQALG